MAECGLGFWQLAMWHGGVHASLRAYQLLNTPHASQQTNRKPSLQLPRLLAKQRWAFVASLQRFWLDPITDWTLVNPVLQLGKDLSYFDDHIVNALMGAPAPSMNALATLAQLEAQQTGTPPETEAANFGRGSGIVGKLAESAALCLQALDALLVSSQNTVVNRASARYWGTLANRVEQLLLRPRYLSVFVFITLLAVF
jgi:hypothetical protein